MTNSNFLVTELPTDVGTAETGHFEAETAVEGPSQIGTTVNILNGPESLVGQTNNEYHWTGDVQVFTCPQTQLLSQGGDNTMLAVHPDSDMGGPVNIRCDNTGENQVLNDEIDPLVLPITFEYTPRDTPQHNVVVERK